MLLSELTVKVPHEQSRQQSHNSSQEQQSDPNPQLLLTARHLLQMFTVRGWQELEGRVPVLHLQTEGKKAADSSGNRMDGVMGLKHQYMKQRHPPAL